MKSTSALFTDFYSLTMAQGYWKRDRLRPNPVCAVFEMFFRHQPFNGGYSIFAGLGTLLESLAGLSFSDDDITYLKSFKIFEDGFLDFLKTFRFNGNLWAMNEGTIIFPQEPVIRVEGTLIECQIIEGMILNIINFQTLIATKTCRIWLASKKGSVMEFGLRRAQGPDGALSASRAAFIGGASGTSNTLAGKTYGIPAMGTMAHSWIMSFDSEEEAFENYAGLYPDRAIFLIDTYDTLKSGIQNAIKVGKKLAAQGKNFGVRLDSGDIQYLSTEVRRILDDAGLTSAFITVSNDLDEYIIETLVKENAPVNSWGVGTKMITGGQRSNAVCGAFCGVYKMSARIDEKNIIPVMKVSDNPEKTTNPAIKQVWRIKDKSGFAVADVIGIENTDKLTTGMRCCFWHPCGDYRHFYHTIDGSAEPLLKKRIDNGVLAEALPSLAEIKTCKEASLESFDSTYKRLLNPHIYKVSITENLRNLKLELIQKHLGSRDLKTTP
ncbi:MAG: nicotinate phosphoribosyltransferase [Treponema sp.]|jgi:nicotinate phosphoribosyltransferase|nr:nicotinate phosphoribosyltransferase [Treponema sp.]